MLPTFILFLREGLEAALIVSILFAALRQLGQMQQARAVWTGIILAILGSIAGGFTLYMTIHQFQDTPFEIIFEGAAFLLAVIMLTGVTFWMQVHSRTLKKEIMTKASTATSGFALGVLAFSTVGREGLETAFFTLAIAFQTNGWLLLIGAVLGLLAAIGLCFLIYRMGYRLDYRVFFRVMGILLIFFAAGLLGNAVHEFQEIGWLPFGTAVVWNTEHILSTESDLGALLKGV
ncbi:MAG: FTR1 family protein, partial [Ktedonobacteraceae bacterium]|nr:FTR1 family protein [Ktedonobacteraceae bacterium]